MQLPPSWPCRRRYYSVIRPQYGIALAMPAYSSTGANKNLSADVGAKSEEVYQPKEVTKRFILSSLHRLWSLYHVVKPEYEKRIASAGYQNTFVSQYHSQRFQLLLPRYTVHHFRRSEQKRLLADGFAYELPSPAPQLIRWSGRPAADQWCCGNLIGNWSVERIY